MSNKKEKIMEAYIQLLDENPTKRVTVNNIVARCGVSRNTFYYYFPDIPSLIAEIEAKWVGMVEFSPNSLVFVDCLRPLAKYAEEHRSGLIHAYHSSSVENFLGSMERLWDAIVKRYVEQHGNSGRDEAAREAMLRFFKGVFIGTTINWLDAEMSYDLLEEGARVCELLRSGEIVKRLFDLN